MKKQLTLTLTAMMLATPVLATKPGPIGGKKPSLSEHAETLGKGAKPGTSAAGESKATTETMARRVQLFKKANIPSKGISLETLSQRGKVTYEQKLEDANGNAIGSKPRTIEMAGLVAKLETLSEAVLDNGTSAEKDLVTNLLRFLDQTGGQIATSTTEAQQLNREAIKYVVDAIETIEMFRKKEEDATVEDIQAYADVIKAGLAKAGSGTKSLSDIYEKFDKDARERQRDCTKRG